MHYVIPQGTPVAVVNPNGSNIIEIQADEDLIAIYKGTLLDLEKEANKRVLGKKTSDKKKALWGGIGASILAVLAGIVKKLTTKKEK